MSSTHHYTIQCRWTGNTGEGTRSYTGYERSHTITAGSKVDIHCSSDPAFRGDEKKYNPEELFLSSISSCHMLWYLHLCAVNHIVVLSYEDNAEGVMTESGTGGRFTAVVLHPEVTIADPDMIERAHALHAEANKHCFIANSLNITVEHKPLISGRRSG